MFLFNLFLVLHLIGGFTALLIFWIPIVTKKGGKIHNRIGWVYVLAMGLNAISAWYMSIYRIFFDAHVDPQDLAFFWFLIFVAILSSACAWYGVRVLGNKQRKKAHRNVIDLGFSFLLFISGIMISIYGFYVDFALLKWFPLVGVFLGGTQFLYWLKAPTKKMHWLFEHMVGMLSCCIATITAFVVFGAPRLLQIQSVHPMLWFLPTIIIVPIMILMAQHYERKYNVKKKTAV